MKPLILTLLLILPLDVGLTCAAQDKPVDPSKQADFGWQVFSPPDKSFTVELPSPPELEHDSMFSDELLLGESYTSIGADNNLSFYMVAIFCANRLNEAHFSLDQYLQGLMALAREKHRVTMRRITVDGFPAREIVSTKPDDNSFDRWITVGSRIYMLSCVSGGNPRSSYVSAQKFFKSFHLTRNPSDPLPGCLSSEGRLPVATRGTIKVVVFPGDWMQRGIGKEHYLLSAEWYEIRSARMNSEGEFLFGAMDYRDERAEKQDDAWYAATFFGARFSGSVQTRKASEAEWKQAKVVSSQPDQIFVAANDDTKPDSFEYSGHRYFKPSEHWGAVFASPGKRWLAVYSYSGKPTMAWFLGGGLPHEGDVYWDVYDTATAEKVLSWSAKYVRNPGLLGRSAVWIKDDYLVMPFGSDLKSCVIGILPR